MAITVIQPEQDGETYALTIEFEAHRVELVFEARIDGDALAIEGLHIQGVASNALGTGWTRRLLRAFVNSARRCQMPKPLLFKVADEPAAQRPDDNLLPIRSDVSISITGWRPGFRKVSATRLLSGLCGYRLSHAKRTVDRILEGERVRIGLPMAVRPRVILQELEAIGLAAKLDAAPVLLEVKPADPHGWLITSGKRSGVNQRFPTKIEATRVARQIARDHPAGRLRIFGRDNRLQVEHSYS